MWSISTVTGDRMNVNYRQQTADSCFCDQDVGNMDDIAFPVINPNSFLMIDNEYYFIISFYQWSTTRQYFNYIFKYC